MRRKTVFIAILPALAGWAALALGATPGAAQEPLATEAQRLARARQAALVEVARVLADPTADERQGAIHILVHIASRYSVLPEELRTLLIRATGDPDPEVATFADRALFTIEHRREEPDAQLPEAVRIERSRRRDFERARAILGDSRPTPGERLGAMRKLIHLLSSAPGLSDEVVRLLAELRSDDDPDVADLAEEALANLHRAASGKLSPRRTE